MRKNIARDATLLAVGCALSLATRDAAAYTASGATWPNLPPTYRIAAASLPSSIASTGVSSIDAAFATWAAPACTKWRATNAGDFTSTPMPGDGVNSIVWLSSAWPSEFGDVSTTISAVTVLRDSSGHILDADIYFNAIQFQWNNSGTPVGRVDTQSIAMEAIGRFLGLYDSTLPSSVMYTYSGGIKRVLSLDDSAAVCALYPSTMGDGGASDAGAPMLGGSCVSGCATHLCANGTTCTEVCLDDCNCPASFHCASSADASTLKVCVPGPGSCGVPDGGADGGPSSDGGSGSDAAAADAGGQVDASVDASFADADIGDAASGTNGASGDDGGGCGCVAVGDRFNGIGACVLAGVAIAAAAQRRRRRAGKAIPDRI